MKFIFATLFLVLSVTVHVFAQASIPKQGVWATPLDAPVGEAILLNALVYNNTATTATITVVFSGNGTQIGSATVTVEKDAAKTASVPWVQPTTPVDVSAEATKAIAGGKAVPALTGVIGKVSVGSLTVASVETKQSASGIIGKVKGFIEPFRLKYAQYFSDMRDRVKARVGIAIGEQVGEKVKDMIAPEIPAAPEQETMPNTAADDKKLDNPFDYVTLVFASAMVGLFGNPTIFYVTLILVVLLVLRAVIARFV